MNLQNGEHPLNVQIFLCIHNFHLWMFSIDRGVPGCVHIPISVPVTAWLLRKLLILFTSWYCSGVLYLCTGDRELGNQSVLATPPPPPPTSPTYTNILIDYHQGMKYMYIIKNTWNGFQIRMHNSASISMFIDID